MKILSTIWSFINSKFFGYVLAIIFIIILAQMCQNNKKIKNEIVKKDQNISALTDTISSQRLKNGALQVSIDGFIASEKDLKKLSKGLYDELQLQKGKVISLNHIIIYLKQDTLELNRYIDSLKSVMDKPIKINDSTYIVPWELTYTYDSTNYDIFKGESKIGMTAKYPFTGFSSITLNNEGTKLTNRVTQIELVWGQKWEKGHLRVFANSSYPGFSAKSLEGVLLDNVSKKNWFNGIGVGPTINIGYDFYGKRVIPIIGVGVHYNIYNW